MVYKNSTFLKWFVGFTDAEGNFNISLRNRNNNQYTTCLLTFQIGLHIDDLSILKLIKSQLNCGHISIYKDKCNFFVNDSFSLINIIIPLFNDFPLNTSKYYQFLIFEKAVSLLNNKQHLTSQGRLHMLQYYFEMQDFFSQKSFPLPKHFYISPSWLCGFTEGDGCFSTNKNIPRLRFENDIKEYNVLNEINLYFNNIGNLSISKRYRKNKESFVVLEFNQISFLKNIIIELYKNNHLYSKKIKDFHDWSIIVDINYFGYHLLPLGDEIIKLIKSQMNNFRLSSNLHKSARSANSFETISNEISLKLKKLYLLDSPYEIKENFRYIRNTNKLVPQKISLMVINDDKKSYFKSIGRCSARLKISRQMIKKSLTTGIPYKGLKFVIMSY